jgi:hypothetical protein
MIHTVQEIAKRQATNVLGTVDLGSLRPAQHELTWIVGLLADVAIALLNSANDTHASGGYKKTGNEWFRESLFREDQSRYKMSLS